MIVLASLRLLDASLCLRTAHVLLHNSHSLTASVT